MAHYLFTFEENSMADKTFALTKVILETKWN